MPIPSPAVRPLSKNHAFIHIFVFALQHENEEDGHDECVNDDRLDEDKAHHHRRAVLLLSRRCAMVPALLLSLLLLLLPVGAAYAWM